MRIANLTSVHPRYDSRVFYKICKSLVANGCTVDLIVADGLGNSFHEGVNIVDVGRQNGRLARIIKAPGKLFSKALELDADIYHLHDPELLFIGLKLNSLGYRVIYDSHEDVPTQLLSKPYLNKPILLLVSFIFRFIESWICRRLSGVIGATPHIRNKFLTINPCTIDVNNYPLVDELDSQIPWAYKAAEVCYIGGIGRIRGIEQLVKAMEKVSGQIRLNLCGRFSESDFKRACKAMRGWQAVIEHGFVDRAGVRKVLCRSVAGLVTLHPVNNYLDALPVKMFEYMSAGIPVIASDFPLWREIVIGNQCGLCVDPMDSAAIAGAIEYLVQNPDEARQMGENGRRAVLKYYNWSTEEAKLLTFYKQVLGSKL